MANLLVTTVRYRDYFDMKEVEARIEKMKREGSPIIEKDMEETFQFMRNMYQVRLDEAPHMDIDTGQKYDFQEATIIRMGCGFALQMSVELYGGEKIVTFTSTGGHGANYCITMANADSPIEVTERTFRRNENYKLLYKSLEDESKEVDGEEIHKQMWAKFRGYLPDGLLVHNDPMVQSLLKTQDEG